MAFDLEVDSNLVDDFINGMKSITKMPLSSLLDVLLSLNYFLNGEMKELHELTINDSIQEELKRVLENDIKGKEIDKVLQKQFEETTTEYTEAMNTPVEYGNGFTYFPRYAEETYQGLIVAEIIAKGQGATTFPRLIKDSTKLAERAVSMTYEELLALTTFLATKQEQLWTIKANKESELLVRKEELEEQLKELLRIN